MKLGNLAQRVVSAIVLIPVALGAVWMGGLAYNTLLVVALMIALFEWIALTHAKARTRLKLLSVVGVFTSLMSGLAFGPASGFTLSLVVWLAVLLAGGRLAEADKEAHFSRALWLAAGVPYLTWSGLAMISLRADPEKGLWATLYVLLAVWGTDIGAYFAGRAIGGPKIWPQVSPKKTWAGLFGGMALAGALGYGVVLSFGGERFLPAVVVAMLLAIIAQVGDFFESHVKRRAGAKDSGRLIPGHGGVLDRVDGLLFAAIGYVLLSSVVEVL